MFKLDDFLDRMAGKTRKGMNLINEKKGEETLFTFLKKSKCIFYPLHN